MMRILPILLIFACAHAEQVSLTWESADDPSSIVGYAVLLATNNGTWKTNAFRLPANRTWSGDIAPGTWKLGVQTIRKNQTNSTHIWSCGFRVPQEQQAHTLTFTGSVAATMMVYPHGSNVIFWLRPSVLTRRPIAP